MFRNKEIRWFAALFAGIALAGVITGFSIQTAAGILVLALVAILGAVFFIFTGVRYQHLAGLTEQIDQVLHNEEHLIIADGDEGELSILQSEIVKMTQRIREQNTALKKEKAHLAESLADIAHQLRTPLTSANLILSLLKEQPDETMRRALLRESQALFAQMDWLLDALLKLSRLDAGIVEFGNELIEAKGLIEAAARPLAIPMELHDITLRIDVPDGAALKGDKGWLAQALQNLLRNCMESAGDGGRIAILCADNPLYTEIAIHDSGRGFAKEELPHLFERFYRGRHAGAAGYGIGLALCKRIVTCQGGTITAKNHRQGGALFTLRFPK